MPACDEMCDKCGTLEGVSMVHKMCDSCFAPYKAPDPAELLREALTMCLATFEMFSEAAAGDISSSDLANAVNKSVEMATAALGETK